MTICKGAYPNGAMRRETSETQAIRTLAKPFTIKFPRRVETSCKREHSKDLIPGRRNIINAPGDPA